MFKIIQRDEIPKYFREGRKVYQFYYHTRRMRTTGGHYTAYCIADSIISARQQARELCRNNGFTLDDIQKYWCTLSELNTELKGEEIE